MREARVGGQLEDRLFGQELVSCGELRDVRVERGDVLPPLPVAQIRLGKTWPKIRAKARKDGGEVLFADQGGIRSDQVTAGPGVRGGGPRWCGGAGTGSR
ncbi:hypothetical protein [Streptomyces bacillaris]|uniref:hypothetical protein n=1 Tax=Streptomyces bacillaris TaxID=68179 RepID=UPI0040643321